MYNISIVTKLCTEAHSPKREISELHNTIIIKYLNNTIKIKYLNQRKELL